MTIYIKAIEEGDTWALDILGVPFGSSDDRDADGEYFDAMTNMHEDRFGLPPLVHYHGYSDQKTPAGEPEYVGTTIKRWVTAAGVWFRATLDKASARAAELWEAAKNGTLRASSGSIVHLVRTDPDGHIREWPVAELSILDTATGKVPANRYAVALPVAKAVYARAGLQWPGDDSAPEVTPEAGDTAAVAERKQRAAIARARAYDILLRD